jgi:hypothetical protein
MARTIIGVIVGYVLMFILNICCFIAMYAVLGQERSFEPRLYLASTTWIAGTFAICLITGAIAGVICAVIARGGRSALMLAIAVIVLGLALTIPSMMKASINSKLVRSGDTPSMQAAQLAYYPVWCPFAFPFISAVGVLIGGKMKSRS